MTRLAVGFGRAFPRVWLLPIGSLTLILGVAVSGRLSRSIAADLLAWWPVWLGLAAVAYFLREKKFGALRAAGLVPLVALLFVAIFLWGHLAGWTVMPSAAHRLVGPEPGGFTEAFLEAGINGEINVRGGSDFLYRAEPVKSGGTIGIPGASEQVVDSAVSVELEPPADPGVYAFAGWHLFLSETQRWALSLDGAIDADLTTLTLSELELDGAGIVRLGSVDEETPVTVDGSFDVIVPPDTPVRVVGVASVPASWSLDDRGATAPAPGSGWVISVVTDADVTVAVGADGTG